MGSEMCIRDSVYDVPVCAVTHVTVVLEEMPQRAVFIQHVTVNGDAMTDFTQGIEVWPVWYSAPQDWTRGGYCTGRVLCDRSGQPLAASFSQLEQTATTTQGFFGTSTRETVTAVWSWPRRAANGRAYLIFDAVGLAESLISMAVSLSSEGTPPQGMEVTDGSYVWLRYEAVTAEQSEG